MATGSINAGSVTAQNIQATTGQSLTIKDEDGNAAITIGTDNTAAGYLGLNFGSYHGDSGGAGSGTLSANTLDDYEEGTWTGTLQTSNNNISGIFLSETGSYIKIGNLVFFNIYIGSADIISGTGYLVLQGLPFTSDSTYYSWVSYGFGTLLSASNGGYVQLSSNYIKFIQRDSTNSATWTTGAKYAMVSGSYISA